jgi:hypothetical protein
LRGVRGVVRVAGCLRGTPLLAHSLLHISGVGPVRIRAVEKMYSDGGSSVRIESDAAKQDQTTAEAVPDTLLGEQTWPTEDEMRQDKEVGEMETQQMENDEEDGDDDDDDDDDDDFFAGLEQIPSQTKKVYASAVREGDPDGEFQREDDYVDVPEDQPAKERFARYRSLNSFRNSYWHPKEALPFQYAKIFQFDDIRGMQRQAIAQSEQAMNAQLQPVLRSLKDKKKNAKENLSRSRSASLSEEVQDMQIDNDDDSVIETNDGFRLSGLDDDFVASGWGLDFLFDLRFDLCVYCEFHACRSTSSAGVR